LIGAGQLFELAKDGATTLLELTRKEPRSMDGALFVSARALGDKVWGALADFHNQGLVAQCSVILSKDSLAT
jgi:hypothetical protein